MTRSISILSFITSLLLFYIKLPWLALIPLVISMYIIFTNWDIQTKNDEWKFSRYHILFWLRCVIIVWLSLLLDVIWLQLFVILCALLCLHMVIIRWTLLANFQDEFVMFHIGYYFISCILLWYVPVNYGIYMGMIARLLFPICTFLLYAIGSFLVDLFVPMPLGRHYRTWIFFLISFLSSIILYFFSSPSLWWSAAMIFYVIIVRFLVYQYTSYLAIEKRKNVYAEDILEGKKVIQQVEWVRYSSQAFLYRILYSLKRPLRLVLVLCGPVLLWWVLVSSIYFDSSLGFFSTMVIIMTTIVLYAIANNWWAKIKYPVYYSDALLGLSVNIAFGRVLFKSTTGFYDTTFIFIWMGWSIIMHAFSILFSKQLLYWNNKRKFPLLLWYMGSNIAFSIMIIILLSWLWLAWTFLWSIILLYIWVIWTMLYFCSRTLFSDEV